MKKLKNKDIKDYNKYKLLQVIKQEGAVTIEECCSKVKLSRPTVSRIIQELRYEDIIAPTGCVGDTGGRSAKLFGINYEPFFQSCFNSAAITASIVNILLFLVDIHFSLC